MVVSPVRIRSRRRGRVPRWRRHSPGARRCWPPLALPPLQRLPPPASRTPPAPRRRSGSPVHRGVRGSRGRGWPVLLAAPRGPQRWGGPRRLDAQGARTGSARRERPRPVPRRRTRPRAPSGAEGRQSATRPDRLRTTPPTRGARGRGVRPSPRAAASRPLHRRRAPGRRRPAPSVPRSASRSWRSSGSERRRRDTRPDATGHCARCAPSCHSKSAREKKNPPQPRLGTSGASRGASKRRARTARRPAPAARHPLRQRLLRMASVAQRAVDHGRAGAVGSSFGRAAARRRAPWTCPPTSSR